MSAKSFFKLVELPTKVASVIPFLIGTAFTLYYFEVFNFVNCLIMFGSLLAFDMCTTTINNYLDYKKAQKKHGYGYENHNAIVRYQLKESTVLFVLFSLLLVAVLLGFWLYIRTDIVVLLLGILSFMVGICYTFGPVPISRTPFGELFSGGFMGLIIPFLAIYIHVFEQNLVTIDVTEQLVIGIDYSTIIKIIVASLPMVFGIANIMLANNICDIEDDIENKRYTLPIYIGKSAALVLFKVLYLLSYFAIVISVILGSVSTISLLTVLTIFPVTKQINLFFKHQSKKDTFVVAIKNFLIINGIYLITIIIGLLIKMWF